MAQRDPARSPRERSGAAERVQECPSPVRRACGGDDRGDHGNPRGTRGAHFGHSLGSDPTDRDDRTRGGARHALERGESLRGAVLALGRRVIDGPEDQKVGPLAHRLLSLGE